MKKIASLLAVLFLSIGLYSQLSFQKLSFENTLQKATAEGKYVMVVMDAKDCDQCNEVADKAFSDPKLDDALREKFVCIRLKPEQDDWTRIGQEFHAPNGMTTLFFTSNGVLLHRYNGTTSLPKTYADQAQLAIDKEIEVININSLTKAWEADKKNIDLLQSVLLKRKDLGLSTDTLLDVYVKMLAADSVSSLTQLQFIASFAPILGSTADSVLRGNFDLFNQAWYRIDPQKRVSINNTIIYKTRNKAIAEQNEKLAQRVAAFASSTNNNPREKQRAYEFNIMEYRRGIKDTMGYIQFATHYYNTFYMSISVDSILRKDSLEQRRMLGLTKGDTVRSGNKFTVRKSFAFRPTSQFYTNELNNAAWTFYTMTKDPTATATAAAWAERANMFHKSPESLDTYARLLYKSSKKNEAIALENEAISLQSKRGYPTKSLDEILANMKAGSAKIDEY